MKSKNKNTAQAILLMAYGTPETADDIAAYYTDIRRGHPPEAAQLEELQSRYSAIGGKTPLLRITREQATLLEKQIGVKTYIGMKHWYPYIKEAVIQMAKDGVKQIVTLVLAPHYSVLSIGDYETRLKRAIDEIDPSINVSLIKGWGDNAIFIDSLCQRIETTRAQFPRPSWSTIEVVFTAHSLPTKILEMGDPYEKELLQTSTLIAKKLQLSHWRMSFQSAGRTRDTWLGPDILQELQTIALEGKQQVLVAPIGFTADNLEILYDLDIQAAGVAKKLGLTFKRIPSANASERFIDALENVLMPYVSAEPF